MIHGLDEATRKRLDRIISRGVALPALPKVADELMSLTREPVELIKIKTIVNLVQHDAGLSARILQMANSSYYSVTREVTNLHHAIVIIGLRDTINLLNFYLLMNTIPQFPTIEHFSSERFWAHSWECGTAARLLGRPQYLVRSSPGTLYLAGLLHDVGKAVLAMHLTEEFGESLRVAREEGIPLYRAEKEVIGIDHAQLGGYLMTSWNLPGSTAMAAAFHHYPEEAEPEDQELAGLIHFADLISCLYEGGEGEWAAKAELSEAWITKYSQGPLSSRETQQKVIAEIFMALKRKANLFCEGDVDEEPDEITKEVPAQTREEEVGPKRKEVEPARSPPDRRGSSAPLLRKELPTSRIGRLFHYLNQPIGGKKEARVALHPKEGALTSPLPGKGRPPGRMAELFRYLNQPIGGKKVARVALRPKEGALTSPLPGKDRPPGRMAELFRYLNQPIGGKEEARVALRPKEGALTTPLPGKDRPPGRMAELFRYLNQPIGGKKAVPGAVRPKQGAFPRPLPGRDGRPGRMTELFRYLNQPIGNKKSSNPLLKRESPCERLIGGMRAFYESNEGREATSPEPLEPERRRFIPPYVRKGGLWQRYAAGGRTLRKPRATMGTAPGPSRAKDESASPPLFKKEAS